MPSQAVVLDFLRVGFSAGADPLIICAITAAFNLTGPGLATFAPNLGKYLMNQFWAKFSHF